MPLKRKNRKLNEEALMAKKKKTARNYLWVLVAMAVCAVLIPLFFLKDLSSLMTQTDTLDISVEPTRSTTYAYHSKLLRITIDIPNDMQGEESSNTIVLRKGKATDEIKISRIGTNYSNLNDYLMDLSAKHHFVIEQSEKNVIESYEALKGQIKGEKYYFIYVDNLVFSFTTESQPLYADLDKIAQSFRYTPEK